MNTIESNLKDFPKNKNTKKKYKVLLCAGGGLFGYVITYLMSKLDFDLYSKIDVAAGTSIGGILTLLYSVNSDYKFINDLFKNRSGDVFKKKLFGCLRCPRYDNNELEKMISIVTGDYTLADIKTINKKKLHVIIPTLDMTLVQPRMFTNIGIKSKNDPRNIKLSTLGLYTAAAPTYFPAMNYDWTINENMDLEHLCSLPSNNQRLIIAQEAAKKLITSTEHVIPKKSAITDGGIIENIPVITTYTTLKSLLGIDASDIDMLILGTGDDYNISDNLTAEKVNDWNLVDWLFKFIIPYITEANETTSVNWGAQLGFNSFKYFNPLNVTGAMDDVDILPTLESQCEGIIDEFKQTITDFLKK